MRHCIFCDAELTPQTKPEHILLDAFGGRKKVRTVVCSDCNGKFGRTIDAQLANQTLHIRNLLQLPNGSSGEAPTLKRVGAGNMVIDIAGDGTMKVVGKPFVIDEVKDGVFNVRLSLNDVSELDRYLPHIAAQTGISIEKLKAQLGPSQVVMTEQRPDVDPYNLSFGGEDAIRAAAKACLVLWTTLVGNDETRGELYQSARNYIVSGDAEFNANRTSLDVRLLPFAADLAPTYSPIFNFIYVTSNADGRVIGHYTLNNIIAFQVILAEKGGTPNTRVALVSNPVTPSVWSDKIADSIAIEFGWFSEPKDDDFKITRDRLGDLMKFYFEKSRPGEISRIVDDVMAGFGINDDHTSIPLDLWDEIVPLISSRVAAHALGLPHKQEMTYEQWQEAEQKKKKPKGGNGP